jgi:hypothetical protein
MVTRILPETGLQFALFTVRCTSFPVPLNYGVVRVRCSDVVWGWYICCTINPWNTELNPICHLLALLAAHRILHVSSVRIKEIQEPTVWCQVTEVATYPSVPLCNVIAVYCNSQLGGFNTFRPHGVYILRGLKPPAWRPLNIYSTNIRTEYFKHAA